MSQPENICSEMEDSGGESSKAEWDPKDARRIGLAKMLIQDRLSLDFFRKPGFMGLMSAMCPDFKIPSDAIILEDCCEVFLEEKEKFKQHFKNSCPGRVSLTIDRWRTLQKNKKTRYICVAVHYIDNEWKLNKRIISFCPISGNKGLHIGNAIELCLMEWGINEVFSITVDGGKANDVAVSYLRDRFNQSGTGILGGKFLHVRCVAEIINLLAADCLTELSVSVKRVREAVRYILQPHYRLSAFREWVVNQGLENSVLRIDEPTDWRSTYLMLESASKLVPAFIQYASIDEDYRYDLRQAFDEDGNGIGMLDETDCKNVIWLAKILKLLYELTFKISGSSNLTANAFFSAICYVPKRLNAWIKSSDLDLSRNAVQMKAKYETLMRKVEGNNELLCIATMLDPNYKLEFVEFALPKMYEGDTAVELGKRAKQSAQQLFQYYNTRVQSPLCPDRSLPEASDSCWDDFQQEMCLREDGKGKTELADYLGAHLTKWDEKVGVLGWWKLMSGSYPVLGEMARDVLAVPITTVAPEAAFNTRGRVLDKFMSSLTPSQAEALICTRDWMRSSPELVPVGDSLGKFEPDPDSSDDELDEMEDL